MGGQIRVASTLGSGSTFTFTARLPITAPPVMAVGSAAVLETPVTSRRVLVAEDNPVNALLVQKLLARLGHRVVHVWNGAQAVAAMADADGTKDGAFDLVLMDLQMPELDGLAATRQIRALEDERRRAGEAAGRVRILALTANAMKGDAELCFAAGMDGHLTKPIDLAALKAELCR